MVIENQEFSNGNLETRNEDLDKKLKLANNQIVEWKQRFEETSKSLEKELKETKEEYEAIVVSLRKEVNSKDGIIKSLTEQLGDDEDFIELNDSGANPFGISGQGSDLDDASLFEELGGDTGGRSHSLCPQNYKGLAKRLKKRLLFLEGKWYQYKAEKKTLIEEKTTLDSQLSIVQKELAKYKQQAVETKQLHEKEIKSLQNQTIAAFAELQKLKKSSLTTVSTHDEEFKKMKEKQSILERDLEQLKRENDDLLIKNMNWAQENNELMSELSKTEQIAIDSKLHVANIASANDKLMFKINELNKDIKEKIKEIQKLKYYINKYKIELPKNQKANKEV